MKKILLLALLFFACQPEKIVYIEIPVEVESELEIIIPPVVKTNITRTSNTTINNVKFLTAAGRVVNQGPGSVISVRIVLTSNTGYSKTVSPSPNALEEDEWGSWSVTNLRGSYIKYRDVMFSQGN